jgi:hypothetical protein
MYKFQACAVEGRGAYQPSLISGGCTGREGAVNKKHCVSQHTPTQHSIIRREYISKERKKNRTKKEKHTLAHDTALSSVYTSPMRSVWHNDVAVRRSMGVELAPITSDSSALIKNEKEKEKKVT